jgi:alanine racemase
MTVTALISRSAQVHNLNLVKSLAPQSRVLAMIKADAYGHGLPGTAKALADSADAFGVARLEEALLLRAALPDSRIVLMSEIANAACLSQCAEHKFDICLHDAAGIEQLLQLELPRPLNIWLKLDTGMHRLGVSDDQIAAWIQRLQSHQNCRQLITLSHFACADSDEAMTRQQISTFDTLVNDQLCEQSLANSAAIMHYPDCHRDWVRPGIMLYGANPMGGNSHPQLRPVMQLLAPVLSVRDIKAGESVGYGARWHARHDSRIATIGIGYGDGYSRHAPNGTPVFLAGAHCPLVGTVSMDMITIDISEHPHRDTITPGTQAELWGPNNPVECVATHGDTISYTLLTGVSPRVKVIYEE